MKKIRVMHLLANLNVGGMENGVVNLANHIDDSKFSMSICCLNTEGPLRGRLREDIKVFNMQQKPGKAFSLYIRLARLLMAERVDIVHTHNSYTALYGIPAARILHGPIVIHGEHGISDCTNGYRRYIKKLVLVLSHWVTTVSDGIGEDVESLWGTPSEKITVVPNGVDQEKYSRRELRTYVVNGSRKTKDGIILGAVGRLTDEKNYPLLLAAVKQVIQSVPNTRLIIIGDGPLRTVLESKARELSISGSVDFLGERTDVPELLNVMDMFILASYSEGMANCLLEAMAVGLPVIASDIKGNIEIVVDQKTGFLFQSGDQSALVDKIIRLIGNPLLRKQFGEAGMGRVDKLFSIGKMVENYERLYAELMMRKALSRRF